MEPAIILSYFDKVDTLLKEADTRMQAIASMAVCDDLELRLKPLVEAYSKADRALHRQKKELLAKLIELSLLAGFADHRIFNDGSVNCNIASNKITITLGRQIAVLYDLVGARSLDDFINLRCTASEGIFSALCEAIIARLGAYMAKAPSLQEAEIASLQRLLAEIAKIR